MNDPHVVSLTYDVFSSQDVDYSNAEPMKKCFDIMNLEIKDRILTIRPNKNFGTVEEARREIETVLRAWEIYSGIEHGKKQIGFHFRNAKVIDRNPDPNMNHVFLGASQTQIPAFMVGKPSIGKEEYPEPPSKFKLSPDVEILWARFECYLEGQDNIQAMAYAVLSYCENKIGENRNDFAKNYKVSVNVLRTLGRLASIRGTNKDARKFKDHESIKPLTDKERIWIEKTIRILIRRIGEKQDLSTLPQITMSDLPPLD